MSTATGAPCTSATIAQMRVANTVAAWAWVALASSAYAIAPYNQAQLSRQFGPEFAQFSGSTFLLAVTLAYAALLALYFGCDPVPAESKSLRLWRALAVRAVAFGRRAPWRRFDTLDMHALRVTLLKAFFAPLMVMSLMGFLMTAWVNGLGAWGALQAELGWRVLFDRFGFWLLMQLILFVDVLVFTVGYLIETPRLDNQVRSVDPTWLGWAAALCCYPPFNAVSGLLLGSVHTDFPRFDNPTLHLALNVLLLALMLLYSAASVALGLKASNLTHRGIVSRGPYAWVRHPAYTCKNIAWWIGSAPLVALAFGQSLAAGLLALASVAGWTALYVLRALTEEDHLRRVDGDYAQYAGRVRYRFVPGLF